MNFYLLQILTVIIVVLLNSSCTAQIEEEDKEWKELLNQGMNDIRAQKWKEAEKTLNKSLKEAEKFGPEDKRVAASLVNLACCYAKKKNFDKAVKVSRRALKIDQKDMGDSHEVAYDLNQLGAYLDYAGKHKEATSFFLQSKAMSTKLLEKATPAQRKVHSYDLGTTLGHLAQNMVYQKKYDEAKKYMDSMLDLLRGQENPRFYFEEFNRVISMLNEAKENSEIEGIFDREYKALESKYGANSLWIRVINSRHGKYYMDEKDFAKGEEFYKKILANRKKTKQKKIFIAEAANALAVCLSGQGKYKEALPYFEDVLTLMDDASETELKTVKENYNNCKKRAAEKK